MRYLISVILVVAAALAVMGVWRHRLMFGTPRRTLETMVSSGADNYMRCYSRGSRSLIRRVGGDRGNRPFLYSALTGGGKVTIVSEEVGNAEAVLRVSAGEGTPAELRFVREGLGWKFDISDKLSAALRAGRHRS